MKPKNVKVCGMTQVHNIQQVEDLGIDMMGFIFWEQSKRFVKEHPNYLPACKRVGVFVDAMIDEVIMKTESYCLDYVQLHGYELPTYCIELRKRLRDRGYTTEIIKAFNIKHNDDITLANDYVSSCDMFLFDTKSLLPGGSGKQFDWNILNEYTLPVPFLLSGGIGIEDTTRVETFDHPACVCVDLNSKFEVAPGIKDVSLLSAFLYKFNR